VLPDRMDQVVDGECHPQPDSNQLNDALCSGFAIDALFS